MKKEKRNIKVLRIISRMNVGGPSKHVVNLTDGLNKLGLKTLLISGQPDEEEGKMFHLAYEKRINLKIIKYMKRPISFFNDLISFLLLVKEIRDFSPNIVHTHTSKAGILGRLAALLCGVPNIYHTYHGHIFKGYFSKFTTIIIIAIERIFARFTTNIIALTPNLVSELKQILKISSEDKIISIPLGLDLSKNLSTPRFLNKWRESLGLKKEDFTIGIVGRLVPVKNHEILINSISKLSKIIPNLHLAIIGDGELKSILQHQCCKLCQNDNIHFCGIIDKLENIYSDLDLLILCSKNEGTPVALIEALASGCPVAATNVGGVSEVLEDGKFGKLLPLEEDDFTEALLEVITDIKNNNYKEYPNEETRKKICDRYSVETLTRNIYSLYNI